MSFDLKAGEPAASSHDAFNLDNFDLDELNDRRRIVKLWLNACAGESGTSMAGEAGVDRRQVYRWSRGEAVPDRKTSERLREAYRSRREGEDPASFDKIVLRDMYEILSRDQQQHRIENDVQSEISDPPMWLMQARDAAITGSSESAVTILEVIFQTNDYVTADTMVKTYVQHTYAVASYHLARYHNAEAANREAERLANQANACKRLKAAIQMLYGLIAARQDNGYREARARFQRAHMIDKEFLTPLFNDVCITARGRFESDFAWAAGSLVTAAQFHGTVEKVKFFLEDLEQDEDLTWARALPAYRDLLNRLQEIIVSMEGQSCPSIVAG